MYDFHLFGLIVLKLSILISLKKLAFLKMNNFRRLWRHLNPITNQIFILRRPQLCNRLSPREFFEPRRQIFRSTCFRDSPLCRVMRILNRFNCHGVCFLQTAWLALKTLFYC